jgi:hypothetical protein
MSRHRHVVAAVPVVSLEPDSRPGREIGHQHPSLISLVNRSDTTVPDWYRLILPSTLVVTRVHDRVSLACRISPTVRFSTSSVVPDSCRSNSSSTARFHDFGRVHRRRCFHRGRTPIGRDRAVAQQADAQLEHRAEDRFVDAHLLPRRFVEPLTITNSRGHAGWDTTHGTTTLRARGVGRAAAGDRTHLRRS